MVGEKEGEREGGTRQNKVAHTHASFMALPCPGRAMSGRGKVQGGARDGRRRICVRSSTQDADQKGPARLPA